MTSHDEESNKAKTTKGKIESTKGEKMNLKRQIAVIVLALVASTSLVWSADSPLRETSRTIEGVWQERICSANCESGECLESPVPSLRTFYRDGTTTAYANPPGTGPLDTPEAGVWQREPGSQNYSSHDIAYFYDENGAFAGSGQVTNNVHLTSANSFTASATIAVYDADGNLLFTFCGHSEGTRFE
jgi:hypothetical protein